MANEKEKTEPKKKVYTKVKQGAWGAKITLKSGEVFYAEDTPACVEQLEKAGLTDLLE